MTRRPRGLLVLLDGLGDRPLDALDGRTPLEAAETPNFDALAARGSCGLVDPLEPGIPVETHTGIGVLMGLAPRAARGLQRGPIEAAGVGADLHPGDVALRANFATIREGADGAEIVDRRAGRIREGTAELAATLTDVPLGDGVTGTLHPATQHRAVLHLRGEGLSGAICDTDPHSEPQRRRLRECRPLDDTAAARRTADAVNAFVAVAIERLREHSINRDRSARGLAPANVLLTRGAGLAADELNYLQHLGLKVAVVSGERSVLGLGRLFGFDVVSDGRFSALPDTDLEAKVDATRGAQEAHDLVFLHLKGADVCSHDRDPRGKLEFIERVDVALGSLLLEADGIVGIAADHSTDSHIGRHCGDPVPVILSGPRCRRDDVARFGESDCARGGLGRLSGHAYLRSVLDAMGRVWSYRPSDRGFLEGS